MSEDPRLALLRAGFEAFNRGDADGVLAILADDVESYISPELMNAGTYLGHEGFIRMLGAWNEAWKSVEVAIVTTEDLDPEHVLVEVAQNAIGAGSGVPVEMTVFWLFQFRGGLVRRLHMHADRERAVAAM
jgi:ketosteroid isomerase-like protein